MIKYLIVEIGLFQASSSAWSKVNMENSHYPLSPEQIASYQEDGFLLIRGFLDTQETKHLQEWAQEVHDLPRTPDASYMPYEVNSPPKLNARDGC